MLPPWLPLVFTVDVSPDVRVLFFAVALTLGTGILFGLAPALQVSKTDLHASMKHDSERAGSRATTDDCGERSSACRWRCVWC